MVIVANPTLNKTAIVVAAYDRQYIDDCLKSLGEKYPVIVMDTSGGGHPTGAYIRFYRDYPEYDNFLFIQDSMRALVPDVVEPFAKLMPKRGAVAWCYFKQGFDTAAQEDWAKSFYKGPYPGIGIFGPIFYTNRATLQELEKRNLLPPIPKNKAEAQTTERMWSWSLFEAGMKLSAVGGLWDNTRMAEGSYPVFKKIWGGRA